MSEHNQEDLTSDEHGVDDPNRRKFFKRAAIGGGVALAAGMGSYAAGKASVEGAKDPNWPDLHDSFKPFPQKNHIWSHALSAHMGLREPWKNEQFGRLVKNDPSYNIQVQVPFFEMGGFDNNKPGFTQLDDALTHSSWLPPFATELRLAATGEPNTQLYSWDQSHVAKTQYKFASKKEASDAIRTAARLYGAVRCGIAKRDERWDYDKFYKSGLTPELMDELGKMIKPLYGNREAQGQMQEELKEQMPMLLEQMGVTDSEVSWDEFPFKPKSVIVMAVPMDYDNFATAPSKCNGATAGDGYTKMFTLANAVARFIQGLGYQAVPEGNGLGLSVAYGIAAGLGEGGRNNQLLVPGYGPRIRLCKVYTDFEFVEYDGPRNWGITEFCKSCKKCGEACPSNAIDMADDTHYFFEGEHSEVEGYNWSNHEGVRKFHTDAKRCFDYWMESDTDCGACVAACTFNEPDFWHHWFIMAINPIAPGFLHSAMAELHPAFGYGSTANPEKVKKFWKTGEGMRVNMTNKSVFGTSNKA